MLSVPRRVVNTDVTKIAYHGFSDASKLAVLAALYALVFHKAAPVCQSLLVAKSKTAVKDSCQLQAATLKRTLGAYRCTHTLQALMNHVKEVL